MTKKILLTSVLSVITIIGVAHSDSIITSKGYVDTQIDTTQAQIPAANLNNSTIGSTVVTYTGTSGTLGERGIYNDASSYTAATDEGKLITASALTGAFNALPTTTTTKLVCANNPACTLWTVTNQTAYGNSGSGGGGGGATAACPDESALVENYGGYGVNASARWKNLRTYDNTTMEAIANENGYTFTMSDAGLAPGEWQKDNGLKGRAVCKDLDNGNSDNTEDAYYCYCQITGFDDGTSSCSVTSNNFYLVAQWGDYEGECLDRCAYDCVEYTFDLNDSLNIIE